MVGLRKISIFLSINLTLTNIYNFGCTGIFLKAVNNTNVYARTLEFGIDLESQVLFIPKNTNFTALAPSNKDGLTWNSKYDVLGVNVFDKPHLLDGFNEEGLAGGLFYFPGFAEYQTVSPQEYSKSLPMWQLLTWILTNFKNTTEVKSALKNIFVTNVELPKFGKVPAHLIIHDESGQSIVIEYVNGKLNIHNNPIGVITNSPNFEWHLINLNNYINLNALNSTKQDLNGIKLSQLGQGSGMLGLPGDSTPPSRFVRATMFSKFIQQASNEKENVKNAFHILNNFDIPKGFIREKDNNGNEKVSDFTAWTSVTDLSNRTFYLRTYDNIEVKKFKMEDFKTNKTITSLKM